MGKGEEFLMATMRRIQTLWVTLYLCIHVKCTVPMICFNLEPVSVSQFYRPLQSPAGLNDLFLGYHQCQTDNQVKCVNYIAKASQMQLFFLQMSLQVRISLV